MGIKAAILGAGGMGKGHTRRLIGAGARVVCVCDKSEAVRKQYMEEFPDEDIKVYEDFDEMLSKEEFQAMQSRQLQEIIDLSSAFCPERTV